ncbi:MAG: peptide chain release factor N(5)-glutamine methyltransferase [Treponema sp.]|nr:peptide chain release factor N(5)-glutamine methyltransferase [Treponema sp.]
MTIRETLAEGKALLSLPPSIDTPALDATLLLGEVLRKGRAKLIAGGEDPISGADRETFLRLVSRRKDGECVAYILGRREFRGLEFSVNPHVLVPRPDTETLVEAVLDYFSQRREECENKSEAPLSLLDLCTGSGAVAISLKSECPFFNITASDISPDALETAQLNARRLLGDTPDTVRFIHSDLFQGISGMFDVIVSNPPYIPSGELAALPPEVRREPQLALDGGGDGLELIRRIAAQAGRYLSPGGALLLEADPGQMRAIGALLAEYGFGGVKVYKDLGGRERVISGFAVR